MIEFILKVTVFLWALRIWHFWIVRGIPLKIVLSELNKQDVINPRIEYVRSDSVPDRKSGDNS